MGRNETRPSSSARAPHSRGFLGGCQGAVKTGPLWWAGNHSERLSPASKCRLVTFLHYFHPTQGGSLWRQQLYFYLVFRLRHLGQQALPLLQRRVQLLGRVHQECPLFAEGRHRLAPATDTAPTKSGPDVFGVVSLCASLALLLCLDMLRYTFHTKHFRPHVHILL